jgi:hypothetical protein
MMKDGTIIIRMQMKRVPALIRIRWSTFRLIGTTET